MIMLVYQRVSSIVISDQTDLNDGCLQAPLPEWRLHQWTIVNRITMNHLSDLSASLLQEVSQKWLKLKVGKSQCWW
jgi:hypothetical protein